MASVRHAGLLRIPASSIARWSTVSETSPHADAQFETNVCGRRSFASNPSSVFNTPHACTTFGSEHGEAAATDSMVRRSPLHRHAAYTLLAAIDSTVRSRRRSSPCTRLKMTLASSRRDRVRSSAPTRRAISPQARTRFRSFFDRQRARPCYLRSRCSCRRFLFERLFPFASTRRPISVERPRSCLAGVSGAPFVFAPEFRPKRIASPLHGRCGTRRRLLHTPCRSFLRQQSVGPHRTRDTPFGLSSVHRLRRSQFRRHLSVT